MVAACAIPEEFAAGEAAPFILARKGQDGRPTNRRVVVTGVRWWGAYLGLTPSSSDQFHLRLFESDARGYATANFVTLYMGPSIRSAATMRKRKRHSSLSPNTLYEYRARIRPLAIRANQVYWLSIINNLPLADDWFWFASAVDNLRGRHVAPLGEELDELDLEFELITAA